MAGVALALVDEVLRARRRRSSVGSSPRPRSTSASARCASSRELGVGERLEPEQRAAREQRPGQREERVLGGRAHEHEQPFFDERAATRPAARARSGAPRRGRGSCPGRARRAGPGRARATSRTSFTPALTADSVSNAFALTPAIEAGDRGLARSRRTPQHERRQPVGLDEDPERLARPEQVLLADDLVERPGPQPRRERCPAREPLLDRRREQVRTRRHRRRLRPTTRQSHCQFQAVFRHPTGYLIAGSGHGFCYRPGNLIAGFGHLFMGARLGFARRRPGRQGALNNLAIGCGLREHQRAPPGGDQRSQPRTVRGDSARPRMKRRTVELGQHLLFRPREVEHEGPASDPDRMLLNGRRNATVTEHPQYSQF